MQLKNATLKETKMRNGENAKKKNHTRDQLDKHDFGKSCKKLGKSKKNCKSDQGPTRQT